MPNETARELTSQEMNACGLEAMAGMDLQTAYTCFECSAAAGNSAAAMSAAGMLETGMGVSRDARKAERYYRHAACGAVDGAAEKLKSIYWRKLPGAIAGFIVSGIIFSALTLVVPENDVTFGVAAFALLFAFGYAITSVNVAARLLFFDWFLDRGAEKLRLLQSPIARAVRKNFARYNSISESTAIASYAVVALLIGARCLSGLLSPPAADPWIDGLTKSLELDLTTPDVMSLVFLLVSLFCAIVLWSASKTHPLIVGPAAGVVLIVTVAVSFVTHSGGTNVAHDILAGVSLAVLLVCAYRSIIRRLTKQRFRIWPFQLAP